MLSSFGKGGEWQRAIQLLESMEERKRPAPNVVTYSTAISALGQAGKWQESLRLLESLPKRRVMVDARCYCAAISACGRVGQWQQALTLLESPHAQGTRVINAAMHALQKAKQWQQCISLLGRLVTAGTANIVSYNTAIQSCATVGNYTQAVNILKLLQREEVESGSSVKPNDVTRICALTAARAAPPGSGVLQEVQKLLGGDVSGSSSQNFVVHEQSDADTTRNLAASSLEAVLAHQPICPNDAEERF
jgi:pentatricopeptide repeat protein